MRLLQFIAVAVVALMLAGCGALPAAAMVGAVGSAQQSSTSLQAALTTLDAQEAVFGDVYNRVGPAVVRIETGSGLGSGFLVEKTGYIITNNHVVADAARGQVVVSFSGLFQTVGQVVGTDPDSDVAVVKVAEVPPGVVPVDFGDSSKVKVGQITVAIGNPLGQDRTLTTGVISALNRSIDEGDQQAKSRYVIGGAIQTDASINPGNSGGPLMDTRGRVIGMNTAILSKSGTSGGIGFAVPINLIKKVANDLVSKGKYDHPLLGADLRNVTTLVAKQNNLPGAGVLISPRSGTSPLAQAGLRGSAVLTAIDGVAMSSSDEVIAYIEINHAPGDTITLRLLTGPGKTQDLKVKLGSRPALR